MKILFLDWGCFNKNDTIDALEKMGHVVLRFIHQDYNEEKSTDFIKEFSSFVKKNSPDIAFSYNYFPMMAVACNEVNLKYISFMYDSPYSYLYSYTLALPINYVFLFDRSWVREFNAGGLSNVFYSVLPGNGQKIGQLNKKFYSPNRCDCDLSFVGTFYNEQHNFYERLEKKADEYLNGYLKGIIEAQQRLYGISIVEGLLTDEIIARMKAALPVEEDPMGVEPKGYRYSNYFIKRKITQVERIRLLSAIGERFDKKYDLKLFTVDKSNAFKGFKNMGITSYETEMPFVFNHSRINLNISLRSITEGIPLRCIDIMASGGFLLSNFQSDLAIDFIPGEDFDYFGDTEDMLVKIEYYLTHEKERMEIAENGNRKIRSVYSFKSIFENIFKILGVI